MAVIALTVLGVIVLLVVPLWDWLESGGTFDPDDPWY